MKKFAKFTAIVLAFLFVLNTSATLAARNNEHHAYPKAKEEWQNKRNELIKSKKLISEEVRGQSFEKAKAMVTKAIERAITRLKRIVSRIEKMSVITDERKTKLTEEINTQITTLENFKARVNAASTKDELKAIVSEIKAELTGIRQNVKKIVAEILASHIDKVITKLNTITSNLEKAIAELKNKGEDTAAMEKTLAEAKELITQAKTKNDAGEWKGARRLAESARAKLAKLVGQIKAAQAKLKGGEGE